MNYFLKHFYITFGNADQQAYQFGYLIVMVENKNQAIEKFKMKYPTKSYSFIYNEDEWTSMLSCGYYQKIMSYKTMLQLYKQTKVYKSRRFCNNFRIVSMISTLSSTKVRQLSNSTNIPLKIEKIYLTINKKK